ncbi:MAG: 16S rRNA (cytosine(967)-C(5))-methyltransferase RsmB [Firmicutes bacterium]|nr:16S rRNA (cytosine(967)-C(5))-methyltransferase RsmB [Bacillota bacterium]
MANRGPHSAREGALQILYAVEVEGAYANLVLDRVLREAPINRLDRSLLTELVYGTLRWRNRLDWVLGRVVRTRLEDLTPWIRNILRLGAYQLLFLDRIPASAVCDEGVKLAYRYGHRGVAGLVNGVLRNLARQGREIELPDPGDDPAKHLAVAYSHPEWMVDRWLRRYGFEETRRLCEADNRPAPQWVRVNTLKLSPLELAEKLKPMGIEAYPGRLVEESLCLVGEINYTELELHQAGYFYVQDQSSMLVAHTVDPSEGQRVVDACAGPGGKTSHIAQLMKNTGEILAFDIHQHKLGLVEANCRRMGVSSVSTRVMDARQLPGELAGWADHVLVDAPCSGLGVLARRPDLRWRRDPEAMKQLPALQKELVRAASGCLKPGGTLVYSTCTLEPEENEEVVEWAVENCGLLLDDLEPHLGKGEWSEEDRRKMRGGFIYLFPHIHGTDGFFISRLRRPDGM